MDSRLLEALDAGHLILTAHRRQARQLRLAYAAHRRDSGAQAWETPGIHGWDDWLKTVSAEIMWSGYAGPRQHRRLLSPYQEHVLWERVLSESGAGQVDDLAGTARRAREAWGLLQSYRLPDPATATFANSDVQAFARWMRAYFARCRDGSLMDQARLPDTIGPALRAGAVPVPAEIQLAGFDEFTPQQRDLLKSLEDLGTRLGRVKGPRIRSEARRYEFRDEASEYRAAARWVAQALTADPDGHIAVLIPELGRDRKLVERVFDETLLPASVLPNAASGGRPYNLSVGPRFERYPINAAALSLCRMALPSFDFATLVNVLRSPFFRLTDGETTARANFEMWLRERNLVEFRIDALIELVANYRERSRRSSDRFLFEALLEATRPVIARVGGEAPPSHWAESFKQLLDVWGWPGGGALSSAEFQTVERFRSMLDELAGMDGLIGPLRAGAAFATLRRLCAEVMFQPQTPELAVDLLLPEQAYGLEFTRIWVCGWHADAWPRSPRRNPFVPIEWQRQHEIPFATPEAQLRHAKRLTGRLLQAAPVVVMSSPQTVDDRPVSISPLLNCVPQGDVGAFEVATVPGIASVLRSSAQRETYVDDRGPPLESYERVDGGSGVLRLQSHCPFRAFAVHRLDAQAVVEPTPGIDAMTRGQLVHATLEGVWRRLRSHEDLIRVIESEHLKSQIRESVEEALRTIERRAGNFAPRFRAIEAERLFKLVWEWLREETGRSPFEATELESESSVRIGPLEVRVRADRIDRLDDGRRVIVDYKTGKPQVSQMFGERPAEPQLPLYALAGDDKVAAVSFARVRSNEMGFVGVAAEEGLLPGVAAFDSTSQATSHGLEWATLFPAWREQLEGLAGAYAAGDARVDPIRQVCRTCHLVTLCRLDERITPEAEQ